MFCTVYKLRRDGEKLPTSEVEATARQGWLKYSIKKPMGQPEPTGWLYDAKGMELDRITCVRRVHIENGGVLIEGQEWAMGGKAHNTRQTWWCVVQASSAAGVRRASC